MPLRIKILYTSKKTTNGIAFFFSLFVFWIKVEGKELQHVGLVIATGDY